MAFSSLTKWIWGGNTKNFNARDHAIDKITIHHMAGNLSLQECCDSVVRNGGSCNYCIDSSGKIGGMIDEKYRSWCSSNRANDMRAVTIEVANDGGSPSWHVSDKAVSALIELCADICKRNGIKKLSFTGDTSGNLTTHKMFTATACPGPYLESKLPYIASEVNKRLGAGSSAAASKSKFPYQVKITYKDGMNVRTGAGVSNPIVKSVTAKYGYIYTITAEKVVDGQTWGKLKSGAGWICLSGFTKKV